MAASDPPDDLLAEINDSIAQRVRDNVEAARRKQQRRRDQFAELAERRRHGLAARHRTKLARLNNPDKENP